MSTSLFLSKAEIDLIDTRYKDIIFGFIRQSQQLFLSNNSFYVIPNLVSYIILSYYCEIEEFNKKLCGRNITFCIMLHRDNKSTITAITNKSIGSQSCYGTAIMSSTRKIIHRWKFLVHDESTNVIIGIEETPPTSTEIDFFRDKNKMNYGYMSYGNSWCQGEDAFLNHGGFSDGDKVEMVLNLHNGTLSYLVNDINHGIMYKVKQEKKLNYIMVVGLYNMGDKVSLLQFSNE